MNNKEVVSGKQVACLLFMFLCSGTLLIGQKTASGTDGWISLLLATIGIVPFYYIYLNLLFRYPGKNYFEILENVYGSWLGRILAIFYIFYAVLLACSTTTTQVNFVLAVILTKMPRFAYLLLMLLACFFVLKNGLEILARWAEIIVPLVMLVVLFATPLTITKIHPAHMFSLFYNGFQPVLVGGMHMLNFPFSQALLLFGVLGNVNTKMSLYKTVYYSLFFSFFLILVLFLRNVFLLGTSLMTVLYYPTFASETLIDAGFFVERVEAFISPMFTMMDFIKTAICLVFAAKGLQMVFKRQKYQDFAFWLIFAFGVITYYVFSDIRINVMWVESLDIYFMPLLLFIPLLTWVIAMIKQKTAESSDTQSSEQPN